MKRENFSAFATIDTTPNHRVYYARVASTSGDKVKIYRYAFERMNQEYRMRMLSLANPVERAIAKYEWGEFILEQLPNYADDRSDLYNGAKVMIINAFYTIKSERHNAKSALDKAIKSLNDFTHHIASTGAASSDQRRAIENRKAELKGNITRRRKQYADIVKRCPDHKFEHIKRRAEYFDSIW